MRIIAIPLARARAGVTPVSTFLAQKTPIKPSFTSHKLAEAEKTKSKASSSSIKDAAKPSEEAKEPLSKRIMSKASAFWVDLGREDQKSTFDWKRRTYTLGEKLMDQIEYEEWALKGVDPSIGPTLTHPKSAQKDNATESSAESSGQPIASRSTPKNVSLLFPPSLLSGNTLLSSLTKMTASRQPHHRQRMIWCILGMPLTIPFIVIPVIPNLPFFYLVWRAWSHWRAFQSSKYLSDLIQQGRLIPTPSEDLDQILSKPPSPEERPPASTAITEEKPQDGQQPQVSKIELDSLMILQPFHIKRLSESFKMDRQLSVDLHRARQQTIKAIKSGRLGKLEAAAKDGAGHDKKA
ncbi:uncharacterized protein FA14DRAFT_159916 [Meira miltonrushii]|uniref:Mitochondrial K+-H+ exchange-related-domain-containing protein n=1 Tax=Meira miltonrushii TaxID=1280837 RepID=A0A316VKZ2_9BASI|nr:uncharacterized protein FA14DRAFT_159916 [Meira miltonrushii]PWN38272.1 hypothetical protein FA14DRAFT_159916 [Meira miltonrushii]